MLQTGKKTNTGKEHDADLQFVNKDDEPIPIHHKKKQHIG